MPKMKTKRSAAKRFSLTSTGKIKRKRAGLRHILTKHSTSTKRRRRAPGLVHPADVKLTMKMLPYA